MLRKITILLLFLNLSIGLKAQNYTTYTGYISDQEGKPLSHVTVKLITKNASKTVMSNDSGKYVFRNLNTNVFDLNYTALGFKEERFSWNKKQNKPYVFLPNIKLQEMPFYLDEVKITGSRKKIELKQDTIQYNVEYFKNSKNISGIDLLNQLPGSIFNMDGQYSIHGQPITKIRLNGKDYLDSELKTIGSIIPSNLIDNIQIINDFGDLNAISKNKTGTSDRILNINLKKDIEKGFFGSILLGAGTDKRYVGEVSGTAQDSTQQITVIGNLTNSNLSPGNNIVGSIAESINGDLRSQSTGLNYRNNVNDKITLYGSFNQNEHNNSTKNQIFRETIYPGYSIFNNETRDNINNVSSQRANVNLEFKATKKDYLKISPEIEVTKVKNFNNGTIVVENGGVINNLVNDSHVSNTSKRLGGNLLYNHSFDVGRNLSFTFSGNIGKESINRDIHNTQNINASLPPVQNTSNQISTTSTNLGISYNEPISQTSFLDFNLSSSRIKNTSNVRTLLFDENKNQLPDDSSLSDEFISEFSTQSLLTGYRWQNTKLNFFGGVNLINTKLQGQSATSGNKTEVDNLNIAPSLRLTYNLKGNNIIGADYSGTPASPTIDQLLPIRDIQNFQNIIVGNPGLKQEFRNVLKFHYNKIQLENGASFFASLEFNSTSNKIIQTRESYQGNLEQRTSYINADGYHALRVSYSLSLPFSAEGWMLVLTGSSDQSNNISVLNGQFSKGKNWLGSQEIQLKTNFFKKIKNHFNIQYSLNKSRFSENESLSTIGVFKVGTSGRYNISAKNSIGYDVVKNFNHGFTGINSINPLLINAYYDLKLLKSENLLMRLTALDLLNQNVGISRDVFANAISNTKTNRISRYFMLSLKYNLQLINMKS